MPIADCLPFFPVPYVSTHDGLDLAYERSGEGTPALLIHANGFCKEMWRPVSRPLIGLDQVAVDQRGHGWSAVGLPPFDWWDLARDLLAVVATLGLSEPRIGVGHSSGGAALAMAEILRPGTWDRLVLIEPITFPGPFGRNEDHPLVIGAGRRRDVFDDRDQALASYRGRGPFARWTDEALALYVEHAFHDGGDGLRHLACRPDTEAEFYRMATAHGAWDRLGEIRCPVTVVVGTDSGSHPPAFAEALAAQFGVGHFVSIPDGTHFVPMEQPEAIAEVIRGVIGDVGHRMAPTGDR